MCWNVLILYIITFIKCSLYFFPQSISFRFHISIERNDRVFFELGENIAEKIMNGHEDTFIIISSHSAKVHLIKGVERAYLLSVVSQRWQHSSFLARRSPGSHLHSVDSREHANSKSPSSWQEATWPRAVARLLIFFSEQLWHLLDRYFARKVRFANANPTRKKIDWVVVQL